MGWSGKNTLGFDNQGNKYRWRFEYGQHAPNKPKRVQVEVAPAEFDADGTYTHGGWTLWFDKYKSKYEEGRTSEGAKSYAKEKVEIGTGNQNFDLGTHGGWLATQPSQSDIESGFTEEVWGDNPDALAAANAINQLTGEWKKIASGDSEYHRAVQSSYEDLQLAGTEGGTYIDDEGQEVSVAGGLTAAAADYESAIAKAQTAQEESAEAAGISYSEATESAAISREQSLESARGTYAPAVRQAAAAQAATGFAGTGGGEEARKALSEEFLTTVGGTELGFEEGMEAAEIAQEESLEAADIQFGLAEEAAEGINELAQANYLNADRAYNTALTNQEIAAKSALKTMQIDMMTIIGDVRSSEEGPAGFNPFKTGSDDQSSLYGYTNPSANIFDASYVDDLQLGFPDPTTGGG